MAGEELVGPAPSGWEYTTLGTACEGGGGDIQTGPFGSQLHAADYVPVGIPSIMPQNIGDNRIVDDGIARITPEDAKRLSRYLVRAGDIVYSRRGDVERRALVREHQDGWLCGTGCLRVRLGARGPDPRFTTYYLGHPSVREWIVRHAHGATMPNLNTSILGACPLLVPPPGEQRAIAHILGTLDDKIELNRRMSETLEAMARALFKSWFIDFDPVRRNMARRRGQNQPSPPAPLPRGEGGANYHGGYRFAGLVKTARELRSKQTPAEAVFWELVRDRRLLGLKFRRQHQLGDYIADFCCHEHRLVIEFDGGVHSEKRHKDHKRDAWMVAQGFNVLRFKNEQLLEHPGSVLAAIAHAVESTAPPSPSGRRAGDEGVVESTAFDHLFPARLVDSELGEIPEGWEVGTLGDVADHPRRGIPPDSIEPDTPYIALEHMPRRSVALSEWSTADGLESNKFQFKKGEILFGKLRPYFHKVGVAPVDGVCSTDIVVVASKDSRWFGFILGHVSSSEFVEYTNAGSTGTKMPRTSWADMARYEFALPPAPVAEAFTTLVRPSVDRIIASIHESRTLAALRDALLPKLISGELRVSDPDKFMERVAS